LYLLCSISQNHQPAVAYPVAHSDSRSTSMPPFAFDINRPEMDVRCEDVITQVHGSPMAAGFLTMHAGSFPWTLNYDEVEYVMKANCISAPPKVLSSGNQEM
jgi:ethanolamine utilization protein EutQ (cupin superfamily)